MSWLPSKNCKWLKFSSPRVPGPWGWTEPGGFLYKAVIQLWRVLTTPGLIPNFSFCCRKSWGYASDNVWKVLGNVWRVLPLLSQEKGHLCISSTMHVKHLLHARPWVQPKVCPPQFISSWFPCCSLLENYLGKLVLWVHFLSSSATGIGGTETILERTAKNLREFDYHPK